MTAPCSTGGGLNEPHSRGQITHNAEAHGRWIKSAAEFGYAGIPPASLDLFWLFLAQTHF
jgi:hypothetical protein